MTCEEFAKTIEGSLTQSLGGDCRYVLFVPDGEEDSILSAFNDARDISVADGALPYFSMHRFLTPADSIPEKLEESFRAELN